MGNELTTTVDKIIKLTNRCKIIVRGLLDFARQDTPEKEPMDLNRVLLEVLSLMEGHMILRRVELVKRFGQAELPMLWGQRAKIEQVFLNLIINSAEAMEGQGRLELDHPPRPRDPRSDRESSSTTGRAWTKRWPGKHLRALSITTKPRGRGTGPGAGHQPRHYPAAWRAG